MRPYIIAQDYIGGSMTPEELETFRTVHGHNSFRVYKAFEEGDGGDKYVTVNEAISYAIRQAYEDAIQTMVEAQEMFTEDADIKSFVIGATAVIRARTSEKS
jgi:hypothetical protein